MCDHSFFLCEKICKHRRDVIVGWNCILSLKYSHFLCPLQWQITEQAHWALQYTPGRDPSPGPECQHLLSHNMLWKWLKSSLRARLSLWEIQLSCALTEVQMEEKTEKATVQKRRENGGKWKENGLYSRGLLLYMQLKAIHLFKEPLHMTIYLTLQQKEYMVICDI